MWEPCHSAPARLGQEPACFHTRFPTPTLTPTLTPTPAGVHLLYAPTHRHAQFLKEMQWQDEVVRSVARCAATADASFTGACASLLPQGALPGRLHTSCTSIPEEGQSLQGGATLALPSPASPVDPAGQQAEAEAVAVSVDVEGGARGSARGGSRGRRMGGSPRSSRASPAEVGPKGHAALPPLPTAPVAPALTSSGAKARSRAHGRSDSASSWEVAQGQQAAAAAAASGGVVKGAVVTPSGSHMQLRPRPHRVGSAQKLPEIGAR